jgi:glycosyltransferase involved in cell wall biosynthesis
LACGRPVLVSDRVGCANDMVDDACGRVFRWDDFSALENIMRALILDPDKLEQMRIAAVKRAWSFDTTVTEAAIVAAINKVCVR